MTISRISALCVLALCRTAGDICATADGFHFVREKMYGDMVLHANAQFTGTGAMSHRLTSLQFRPTAGAMSQDVRVTPKSDVSGPVHPRIERYGDRVTVLAGKPGETATSSPATLTAPQDPQYVGLAVSSHNPAVAETAVFTNVSVRGGK